MNLCAEEPLEPVMKVPDSWLQEPGSRTFDSTGQADAIPYIKHIRSMRQRMIGFMDGMDMRDSSKIFGSKTLDVPQLILYIVQ